MIETHDISDFLPEGQRKWLKNCCLDCAASVAKMVSFRLIPESGDRVGFRVLISDPNFQGRLSISIGQGTGDIQVHSSGYLNLEIRMFRNSTLIVGRRTTVNSARIVCDHSDVEIGEDGLWSDEILVQSNDQHGIVDLSDMKLINTQRRRVTVGNHVWIGRRAILMPDVSIGSGSILGTGSILTKEMGENVAFAGVPAKKVRDNVSWSRLPNGLSELERSAMRDRGIEMH